MKLKKLWIPAVVLAAVLVVVLKFLSSEKPAVVIAVPVKRGDVDQIVSSTSSGTVEPAEKANLMSEYPGAVTHIYYHAGDRVHKGAVILSMNNALAKVDLDRTSEAYARARQLFASHAVSKAALDTAMYAFRAARAQYDLSFITSPIDGIITRLNAHLGEFPLGSIPSLPGSASAIQQEGPLVQVIDTSSYHVKAPFDEVDSGIISVGQPARISFDAFPDRVYTGTVIEVAPSVSTALDLNRTIEAKISLPHIRDIRMGMSADVEIIVHVAKNVLFVPTYSIQESSSSNDRFVWIIRNGMARRVEIKTGISNWNSTVVTGGIGEGALVILPSDRYTLHEGMKVVPHD